MPESDYFPADSKLLLPPPTPNDDLLGASSSLRQRAGVLLKPYQLFLLTPGIERFFSVPARPFMCRQQFCDPTSLGHNSCCERAAAPACLSFSNMQTADVGLSAAAKTVHPPGGSSQPRLGLFNLPRNTTGPPTPPGEGRDLQSKAPSRASQRRAVMMRNFWRQLKMILYILFHIPSNVSFNNSHSLLICTAERMGATSDSEHQKSSACCCGW